MCVRVCLWDIFAMEVPWLPCLCRRHGCLRVWWRRVLKLQQPVWKHHQQRCGVSRYHCNRQRGVVTRFGHLMHRAHCHEGYRARCTCQHHCRDVCWCVLAVVGFAPVVNNEVFGGGVYFLVLAPTILNSSVALNSGTIVGNTASATTTMTRECALCGMVVLPRKGPNERTSLLLVASWLQCACMGVGAGCVCVEKEYR